MKDIGIIGSADGPTAVYVSSDSPEFWKSGGIVEENDIVETVNIEDGTEEILVDKDINLELDNRTLGENLDSGIKIMGLGMAAVFGVLTILYVVIKIMGQFAKQNKDKENNNEKN